MYNDGHYQLKLLKLTLSKKNINQKFHTIKQRETPYLVHRLLYGKQKNLVGSSRETGIAASSTKILIFRSFRIVHTTKIMVLSITYKNSIFAVCQMCK